MSGRLVSCVLPLAAVGSSLRREMFDLFQRHYDDVTAEVFAGDLEEKEHVIVIRDEAHVLRGFSTVATYEMTVEGRAIRLLFSGDTIVDQAFWGEQALGRAWSELAGSISAERPETPLYWLLLSKGYRTYLYLPLFFATFYPSRDRQPPPFEKAIVDAFATMKYGSLYDRERGVVAFPHAPARLREDLADVSAHRLRHDHVRFFLDANPHYREGHELVCVARLEPANLRGFARDCFLRGERAIAAEAAG